jgi:hypothetical protein
VQRGFAILPPENLDRCLPERRNSNRQLRVLTSIGGMAADTAALVGEASGEVEILDSGSEIRLSAGTSRRDA